MSSEHKEVNFSEDYELEYIADQYEDLTPDELKGMKGEIKAASGKESNQHVTHQEVYKYLKDMGYTRKE